MEIIKEVTGNREVKITKGKRAGETSMMYFVTTEDGTKASGFDKVEVGDQVEITISGKYTNYKKIDEVDQRVKETDERLAGSEGVSSPEVSRTTTQVSQNPDSASIISNIQKVSADIRGALADPETLSLGLIELATAHEQLGTLLAEALEAERSYEVQLKYEKQRAILTLRKSSEITMVEAEAQAVIQTKDLADQWLEAKKSVDLLRIKREDVRAIIDAGRTRMATIREDISNG